MCKYQTTETTGYVDDTVLPPTVQAAHTLINMYEHGQCTGDFTLYVEARARLYGVLEAYFAQEVVNGGSDGV